MCVRERECVCEREKDRESVRSYALGLTTPEL